MPASDVARRFSTAVALLRDVVDRAEFVKLLGWDAPKRAQARRSLESVPLEFPELALSVDRVLQNAVLAAVAYAFDAEEFYGNAVDPSLDPAANVSVRHRDPLFAVDPVHAAWVVGFGYAMNQTALAVRDRFAPSGSGDRFDEDRKRALATRILRFRSSWREYVVRRIRDTEAALTVTSRSAPP